MTYLSCFDIDIVMSDSLLVIGLISLWKQKTKHNMSGIRSKPLDQEIILFFYG